MKMHSYLSSLLAMSLIATQVAWAAEEGKKKDQDQGDTAPVLIEEKGDATAEVGEEVSVQLPFELDDVAYRGYLDNSLLRNAFSSLDPNLLTDAGLLLVKGEKELLRPHKAVSSEQIFAVAVRAATESRDKEALARLLKVADKLGDKRLAAAVNSAKLAGASRSADKVSLDGLNEEQTSKAEDYLLDIRHARITGDKDGLEDLQAKLKEEKELPEKVVGELTKLAAEGADGQAAAIAALGGASRSGFRIIAGTRNGVYYAGNDRIVFVAAEWRGTFSQSNASRTFRNALNWLVRSGQSCVIGRFDRRMANDRHAGVGFFNRDRNEWRWVAVQIFGNNSVYFTSDDSTKKRRSGWVTIRGNTNGYGIRFSFADDDRGGLSMYYPAPY